MWPPVGPRYCPDCEPRPHKVLMNYGPSRNTASGYSVHSIAEDCRTAISHFYEIRSKASLRELIVRTKASEAVLADFDHALKAWGQGSTWLQLTKKERRALDSK